MQHKIAQIRKKHIPVTLIAPIRIEILQCVLFVDKTVFRGYTQFFDNSFDIKINWKTGPKKIEVVKLSFFQDDFMFDSTNILSIIEIWLDNQSVCGKVNYILIHII